MEYLKTVGESVTATKRSSVLVSLLLAFLALQMSFGEAHLPPREALLRINGTIGPAGKDLVCQLIESLRCTCEVHNVRTTDGYELTVHRIPPSPPTHSKDNATSRDALHPFLLMHGLLGSAADFVLAGRGSRSLAALLHDAGYDVWLANARGTTNSKRHVHLNPVWPQFWNFSWHEIGTYDLPAVVDHITSQTEQRQLHYVAHSQGTTALLVLLSERPEYNERFASATLLAPVAFMGHIRSPPLLAAAQQSVRIEALLNHLGLHELFPSTALNQLGGHLLCGPDAPTRPLCLLATFWTVGFSDYQMDHDLFARILETTPAGISRKQLQHYGQLINTGRFLQFDYGSKRANYRSYGRKTPPPYNLRQVRVPLHLYYGTRDLLMSQQDVLQLTRELPNARYTLTALPGFNHIDLLYADAAQRIYKRIVRETKRLG